MRRLQAVDRGGEGFRAGDPAECGQVEGVVRTESLFSETLSLRKPSHFQILDDLHQAVGEQEIGPGP